MIWMLLFSCDSSVVPESHDWIQETDSNHYISTELTKPSGILAIDQTLLVADQETNSIAVIQDEVFHTSIENILAPTEMVLGSSTETIFVATPTKIEELNVQNETISTAFDDCDSPHSLVFHNEMLFWLEGNQLFSGNSVEPLCSELPNPSHLIEWNNVIWITTQDDNGLWKLEQDDCELVKTFDDIPHKMAASDEGIWVTTRSFRWPYGGWIVWYDGDQLIKTTESPPEPSHVLSWDNSVIWSSKQSITQWAGDSTYEMIASQTTVADFALLDNTLYWSDPHGGRVGSFVLQSE